MVMVVINALLEVCADCFEFPTTILTRYNKTICSASSSFEATVNIQNILKKRDDRNLAPSISIERNLPPLVTRTYSYSFETT